MLGFKRERERALSRFVKKKEGRIVACFSTAFLNLVLSDLSLSLWHTHTDTNTHTQYEAQETRGKTWKDFVKFWIMVSHEVTNRFSFISFNIFMVKAHNVFVLLQNSYFHEPDLVMEVISRSLPTKLYPI